ncbi:MAG: hypothetical protein LBP80_10490 [Treponema sp.]|nr:hypothetical protein [Treponema sp.]
MAETFAHPPVFLSGGPLSSISDQYRSLQMCLIHPVHRSVKEIQAKFDPQFSFVAGFRTDLSFGRFCLGRERRLMRG